MVSTESLPRSSSHRVASRIRCKRPRSRCRSKKNHERSLHRNQQYSVIALTGGSGSVIERYAYSAYGTPTVTDASGSTLTASAANTRYTYTGREYDDALDLYHYRARMYNSVVGRFCSRDPIGYKDGLNLYGSYFSIHYTDPNGTYTLRQALVRLTIERPGQSDWSRQEIFDKWLEMERARGPFWSSLPKCPARLCIKTIINGRHQLTTASNPNPDGFGSPRRIGYHEGRFHPGAYWTMRSDAVNGSSNQCVYDQDGNIIRSAPGHGTVDFLRPSMFGGDHLDHDVDPVIAAAILDGCWDPNGISFGFIRPDCASTNMQNYFSVRPLWASEDDEEDPCDCKKK